MSSLQYLEVVFCFLFANGAHEIFCYVLCCEVFMFWVKDLMDYGTRSGKSLSLGMPMAPQDNLRTPKIQSLGMPRKASPLLSSSIGNFSWSYIFIHHMICVLLGASCMIWVFSFYFTTIRGYWGSPGLRGPRASGLLDMGRTDGLWRYKTEDSHPCPDGTLLGVEGKLGVWIWRFLSL